MWPARGPHGPHAGNKAWLALGRPQSFRPNMAGTKK
jgi:hypothetical protein